MLKQHAHWASKFTYMMAASGAAIGLGNIWRFPYITGINGGGAFVLLYLAFVIILGIPLMASEVLIGRRGQCNPCCAFKKIATFRESSRWWMTVGLLPILTGFLILSFYSVISGWVLHYIFLAAKGTFNHISTTQTNSAFNQLLTSPMEMLLWDSVVIIGCITILSKGLHKGLERAIVFMFPALIVLSVVLMIYAFKAGSFSKGMNFLFSPDFSKITFKTVLLALGQAFFSLGIGTGIMLTYGTYVNKNTSLMGTSIAISLADTAIALIAGMTIFPIVFANNLAPNAGPSLIFKSLPLAFGHMPMGSLFATLFFIMLEFAALTSALALLEPMVMFLIETVEWPRKKAVSVAGFVIWLLSIGSVVSFNIGSHPVFFSMTFFDFLDTITSSIMLPLGGLGVAIFTGWVMYKQDTSEELQLERSQLPYKLWRWAVRVIAPIAIIAILLKSW